MIHRSLVHALVTVALLLGTAQAQQKDTDGDGLLDLMDVEGFRRDRCDYEGLGIEALDGVNLLSNCASINLAGNQLMSIEPADFEGLTNLQYLHLALNQLTSVEHGAFEGLTNLRTYLRCVRVCAGMPQ